MLQGHVKDIENYSYELFEGGKKTFVSTMNEEKHEILSEQYIPSDDDNITKTIEKTNGRTITRIRTFDQGVLVKEETYEEVGQYYYNFSGIIDKYGYLLSYTNKSNDNPDDPDSEYYEEGTFETSYQYHEDGSLLSVDLIFPIIISEEEIYIQHNQDIYIYK